MTLLERHHADVPASAVSPVCAIIAQVIFVSDSSYAFHFGCRWLQHQRSFMNFARPHLHKIALKPILLSHAPFSVHKCCALVSFFSFVACSSRHLEQTPIRKNRPSSVVQTFLLHARFYGAANGPCESAFSKKYVGAIYYSARKTATFNGAVSSNDLFWTFVSSHWFVTDTQKLSKVILWLYKITVNWSNIPATGECPLSAVGLQSFPPLATFPRVSFYWMIILMASYCSGTEKPVWCFSQGRTFSGRTIGNWHLSMDIKTDLPSNWRSPTMWTRYEL